MANFKASDYVINSNDNGGDIFKMANLSFTADANTIYLCDVSANSIIVSLPETLETGFRFGVFCVKGDTSDTTKTITINFNTVPLEGVTGNVFKMDVNSYFQFVYANSEIGFKILPINIEGTSVTKVAKYIYQDADFSPEDGITYLVDTSSSIVNIIVPPNIEYPFYFKVVDLKNTFATNNCAVNVTTNSYNIEGNSTNFIMNENGSVYEFIATESTYGFKKVNLTQPQRKAYGSVSVDQNRNLAFGTTYTNISFTDALGASNNITQSATASPITITKAGDYLINFSAHMDSDLSSGGDNFYARLTVNNNLIGNEMRVWGDGNNTIAINKVHTLAVGDVLRAQVKSGSTTAKLTGATLSIVQV
jgi:hypothetical protein